MTRMTPLKSRKASFAMATAVAAALATAGTAHADSSDDPFVSNRTELGFGMLVGGYSVGPVGGAAVGMHIDIGRQMGPLKLFGEYNLMSVGESATTIEDPTRGMLHRLGLSARYNFAELGGGRYKPIQGAFWLEGGVGRQRVQWYEGGVLSRDDVNFGFGAQMNFKIGKNSDKPKIFGFYYAFKATVARAPDADDLGPATCVGPCDEPTPPSPYDFGLFFNLGLQWGK